jgi:hypothetical protein
MTDNRDVGGNQQHDDGEEDPVFASLTPAQTAEREDIIKALGQRCNALMRYDGKDPALVASALLWCGISMYAEGAPDITRDQLAFVCASTFDEVKAFFVAREAIAQKGEPI